MRCVKCEGTLVTVRVEDIDVDQCDRCAGIWFDAHELERVLRRPHVEALLGRGPAAPDPAVSTRPLEAGRSGALPPPSGDDERRGRCPRCKSEGYLVRLASRRAPIHVDTCSICGGKWLDGGEIDLLTRTTFADRVRRVLDWVYNLDI